MTTREFMPEVSDGLPPGTRPMVAIVHAITGHEDRLAAAITTLTKAVRGKPGCREFRPYRDFADPSPFYLYEIYDDTKAFRSHLATDHVGRFFTELERHTTATPQP